MSVDPLFATAPGPEMRQAEDGRDLRGGEPHFAAMAKMKRKGDLPMKICATCGKPFAWRRKWKASWEEVRYCSERCRRSRPAPAAAQS